MKIEILKNCLDADNRAILVAKSAQEEGFDQIWSEFEKRYARDSVAHHRAHWQNLVLPLEGVNEDHIRWFKSEWEKRRARVEDASEEEEYNLLLERIGAYNAKRIMGEEAKRGRGKYVLKMARVVDFNQGSIEKLIQRTTGALPISIFEDQGWYTIVLDSEEAESKLLGLKGKKNCRG
jgi:hypothetical protein